MSIQSEIDRLTGARESIGSAIAAKGVTVPDDTRLEGMAELISSISTSSSIPVISVTVRNGTSADITVYIANKAKTISSGAQALGLGTPAGTLVVVTAAGKMEAGCSTATVLGQQVSSTFSMTALAVGSAAAVVTAYDAS